MTKKKHDRDALDTDDPGHPDFPHGEGADVDLGMGLHAKAPGRPHADTVNDVIAAWNEHVKADPPNASAIGDAFLKFIAQRGWKKAPDRPSLDKLITDWDQHVKDEPQDPATIGDAFLAFITERGWNAEDIGFGPAGKAVPTPHHTTNELMYEWWKLVRQSTPDEASIGDHFAAFAAAEGYQLTEIEPPPPPEEPAPE